MNLTTAFKNSKNPILIAHAGSGYEQLIVRAFTSTDENGEEIAIITNNTLEPVSPFTGENLVPMVNETQSISESEIEQLSKIAECDNCSSVHRTLPSIASEIEGEELHCVICGETLVVEANSTVAGEEDDFDDEEEASLEDSDTTITTENPPITEDTVPIGDITVTPTTTVTEQPKVSVSMLSLAKDVELNDVTLALTGTSKEPMWYMFVKHVPIATLSSVKASEGVKSIFTNERLLKEAFFASLPSINDQVVKDFGMDPIVHNIDQTDAINSEVSKKEAEIKASFERKETDMLNTFKQCLSMASAGIVKNVFKDKENTLRSALISEFKGLGIENSCTIIDRVLSSEMEKFVATVLSKAFELKEKTLDARNELSQMIETSNYNYKAEKVESNVGNHKAIEISSYDDNKVEAMSEYRNIFADRKKISR